MNKLDKQIAELFKKMIQSPEKITSVKDGEIKFNNGLSISAFKKSSTEEVEENLPLKLDKNTFTLKTFDIFNWHVVIPDTDKLIFYINTPYKQYVVPEFSRKEYAETLDTIDESLEKFEETQLFNYNAYFDK